MAKGSILRALVLGTVLLAGAVSPCAASAAPESRRSVTVLVPEMGNLQALAFWVALGARYFEGEGLDVHVVAASAPPQVGGPSRGARRRSRSCPGTTTSG